jgi:uncharacterized protein involved in type VI secretion and phage assembly
MAASYVNLQINGEVVANTILKSVSVIQELNHHAQCEVECRHTQDQRLFGIPGTEALAQRVEEWLGKDLKVLSYDQLGIERVLFDGFVLEVELEYEVYGSYTARVAAVTRSYKMDVTPRHAYYAEQPLGAIAQQLAGLAQLKAEVSAKDRRPLNYVQWGETDFQFLRRLADDHGCWLRPTAQGIEIRDGFQEGTTVQWRGESGEKGLRNFKVKGALAPAYFNGAHYNPHEMKSQTFTAVADQADFYDSSQPLVEAVRQASNDVLPPGYLPHRCRMVTLGEYEQLLKKESVRSVGSTVLGYGESWNPELLPGNTVEIEGSLDAQGTYGVTRVVHTWEPSGYRNQFTCTPWKTYTDAHPPQFKPWDGVVPARVVEHNDPKKMGRIKVQYFWQEDGPAHWERMITPHAGADRGFMFMPEKGDEVVVGFEDGDPERPVVLGCVWNGVDQAPRQEFWGGDIALNDVKRIVTKSGNHIQMVDKKGKESVVIGTPHSIRVALIANANETGRETLLLESSLGDIILNAPQGRVHVHSKYYSREVDDPLPVAI